MEVTKKNFEEVLDTLQNVVHKAQFLTFDTEFTGLKVEGASNINYFDTLEELYLKDRLKAETFMAIQFGLVAFFYDGLTQKYTHQGYNFYIYPSSYSDVNFTCQSKSIKFLAENGFDFNKLFHDGIPYLRDVEAEKLIQKIEEKHKKKFEPSNTSKIEIPPEEEKTVNGIIKKINEILKKNSKESFITEKYNSFVRKLIFNTTQLKFGSLVSLETNKDETMTIHVGFSTEDLKKLNEENLLIEKSFILKELGFNKVVKILLESKKLLVGHNLFLDLLFTIRQFLTPLPDSYEEFKELVNFLFPKILDTKFLASTANFSDIKSTTLYNLVKYYDNLKEIPDVKISENGKGYHLNDNKLHEAAYDAYVTGLCFLSMVKHLGNIFKEPMIFDKLTESSCLELYLQKISVPRLCDISCINFGGPDSQPDREGVYHVTFPEEWIRDNISELFRNYGFMSISWIDNTSAFVKIKKECVQEMEKNLMNTKSEFKIRSFLDFRALNQNLLLSPLKKLGSIKHCMFQKTSQSPENKKVLQESIKKRQIEDIGERIERPPKRKCSNNSHD